MSESPKLSMFWHDDAVRAIRERAMSGVVVVCGGRGIGKTVVLRQLEESCAEFGSALIIPGGNRTVALEQLRKINVAAQAPAALILIECLDQILTRRDGDDIDVLKDAALSLDRLIRWRETGDVLRIFVVTSTVDFRGPRIGRLAGDIQKVESKRYLDIISPLLMPLDAYPLDPWKGDWRRLWCDRFRNEFGAAFKDPLTTVWCEELRKLTGGHPTLFGPIVKRLRQMIDHQLVTQDLPEFDEFELSLIDPNRASDPGLLNDIRFYVEDLLARSGMAAIRSSIRKLKDSTDLEERRSFDLLVKIVQSGEEDRTSSGMNERAILMEEGLLYRDGKTGRYMVPGSLIQDQVSRDSAAQTDEISVTPDGSMEDGGTLRVGETRVGLKGNAWRILKKLSDARGEFMSLAQLGTDARNSLQRLREDLKAKGVADVVENEYGRGYRLVKRQSSKDALDKR